MVLTWTVSSLPAQIPVLQNDLSDTGRSWAKRRANGGCRSGAQRLRASVIFPRRHGTAHRYLSALLVILWRGGGVVEAFLELKDTLPYLTLPYLPYPILIPRVKPNDVSQHFLHRCLRLYLMGLFPQYHLEVCPEQRHWYLISSSKCFIAYHPPPGEPWPFLSEAKHRENLDTLG